MYACIRSAGLGSRLLIIVLAPGVLALAAPGCGTAGDDDGFVLPGQDMAASAGGGDDAAAATDDLCDPASGCGGDDADVDGGAEQLFDLRRVRDLAGLDLFGIDFSATPPPDLAGADLAGADLAVPDLAVPGGDLAGVDQAMSDTAMFMFPDGPMQFSDGFPMNPPGEDININFDARPPDATFPDFSSAGGDGNISDIFLMDGMKLPDGADIITDGMLPPMMPDLSMVAGPMTYMVDVEANDFAPAQLIINHGDTIAWTWFSDNHTVTSGANGPDGKFCSPSNANCAQPAASKSGSVYKVTFNVAGQFKYFCGIHPAVVGNVIVK